MTVVPPVQLGFLLTGSVSVPRYRLLYIEIRLSSPELRARCGKHEESPSTARGRLPGFNRLKDTQAYAGWRDKGQGAYMYIYGPLQPWCGHGILTTLATDSLA